MNFDIVNAVHQELTLSYTQAGRVVPSTIDVVAASLADALDFSSVQEVHDTFKRARNMEDIPTQRVLKGIVATIREKQTSNRNAITWQPVITKEQYDYIYAWWHLRGTKMAWLTDSQAEEIVDRFESAPKNKEFKEYQHRNWTHVAADNVMKYGTATMRTRL